AVLRPERSPEIIEKDFWVCWSLRRIYEVLRFRPQLIFKGGTSLTQADLPEQSPAQPARKTHQATP
ncbi:MAG: hypothetical protein WCP58_12310, partial [bacterium]